MESWLMVSKCTLDSICTDSDVSALDEVSKSFYPTLHNSHRRLPREELTEIIAEQNQFDDILDQQTRNPESHPLIPQIDQWEKESINKIQQRAKELRERLLQLTITYRKQLSQKFRDLSEQLFYAETYDDFVEADLDRWKHTLNNLKENLSSPSTITIHKYIKTSLVQDMYVVSTVTNELFHQTFDNRVGVEADGQLIIHDASLLPVEVRGKNTYTNGCHKISLHIEQSINPWMFIGISSALSLLQYQSYSSPTSSYGWSTNNCIWLDGQPKPNFSNEYIDMKNDDIINLIIDCESSLITLINERSGSQYELAVNTENCPVPWQLQLVLHEPNSRLRILQK